MELTEKMQGLLKQHLPEMAAKELKEFIAQAENDKKALASISEDNKILKDRLNNLEKLKSEYEMANTRMTAAINAEKVTADKERKLEINMLSTQLAAEKQINANTIQFVTLLVKNPRSIEILNHFTNESQAGYNQGNQWVQPTPISRSEQKNVEQIQTKNEGFQHSSE